MEIFGYGFLVLFILGAVLVCRLLYNQFRSSAIIERSSVTTKELSEIHSILLRHGAGISAASRALSNPKTLAFILDEYWKPGLLSNYNHRLKLARDMAEYFAGKRRRLEKPPSWYPSDEEHKNLNCPNCGTAARIPSNKKLKITCRLCQHEFLHDGRTTQED